LSTAPHHSTRHPASLFDPEMGRHMRRHSVSSSHYEEDRVGERKEGGEDGKVRTT